jgi:hypothetical protein
VVTGTTGDKLQPQKEVSRIRRYHISQLITHFALRCTSMYACPRKMEEKWKRKEDDEGVNIY